MRDRSGPLEFISDTLCISHDPRLLDVRDGDVHGEFSIDIPCPFDRNLPTPDCNPQRLHDPLECGTLPTMRCQRLTAETSFPGVRA